ncbi:MAG: hypothetical protein ACO1N0_04525 [Fluviicola sp.]
MTYKLLHNELEFEFGHKSNLWHTIAELGSEKIFIDGITVENGVLSDESQDFISHFLEEYQVIKNIALEASLFMSRISTQFNDPEKMKWNVYGVFWREEELEFDFIYQVNDYSQLVVKFDSNVEPWYRSMVNTITFGLNSCHDKLKELNRNK